VLDIWAGKDRNPSSILMVSHDIKEVAYMADRIVVLDANPGRVRTVVENRMPRPRDYRSPELLLLVDRLHDVITGMEMPDAPAPEAAAFEPIPHVLPSEIVGLLEYLDARGGREDVFRIASDTGREFGEVIGAANAAEMLDLVDTPRRLVVLAPAGQRFVKASPADRRGLWAERVRGLHLFRAVQEAIQRSDEHRVSRDFVLETLALYTPSENFERTFDFFVTWGRFGEIFAYDEASGTLGPP
jgi:NitT/TauT family transport system ATP-binding protein